MVIELDGDRMTDRACAHAYLRERLDFPDYYGRNLDALYDLLTERGGEIVLRNQERMAEGLVKTMLDAAAHNPRLNISFM